MMSSLPFTLGGDDHVDVSTPLSVAIEGVNGVGLPRSFVPILEVQEPSPQHRQLEDQRQGNTLSTQGNSLQDLGRPSPRDLKPETSEQGIPVDVVPQRSTSRDQRRSSLGHVSEPRVTSSSSPHSQQQSPFARSISLPRVTSSPSVANDGRGVAAGEASPAGASGPSGGLGDDKLDERPPYCQLDLNDIMPLETAKVKFLHLIIDHFVAYHIVPVSEETQLAATNSPSDRRKRKHEETSQDADSVKPLYEGDPQHLLPLIFLANAYESLVGDVTARMSGLDALRGKSMGMALEASGGLYRRIVEKFPKSGAVTVFRRREMASAMEARTRFPQLVLGRDDKRVRFIVVHGLELVERPTTMSPEDAEWFKRVTGRHDVALYPRDYNYFSPRPKPRKPTQPKGHNQPQEDHSQLQSQQQDASHGQKQQAMGVREAQSGENRHQDGGDSRHHQILPMPPELQNSLHHHMSMMMGDTGSAHVLGEPVIPHQLTRQHHSLHLGPLAISPTPTATNMHTQTLHMHLGSHPGALSLLSAAPPGHLGQQAQPSQQQDQQRVVDARVGDDLHDQRTRQDGQQTELMGQGSGQLGGGVDGTHVVDPLAHMAHAGGGSGGEGTGGLHGVNHMSHLQRGLLSAGSHHLAMVISPGELQNIDNSFCVQPSPLAKYCDECGAAYVRETSKFCSECGTKRHGI